MKANEAPEKLWWSEGAVWQTNPDSQRYIEYIRTDAFIEKAAEWIKNKAERYIVDTPLCSYFDYKRAVEDFRNYIKGE